MLTGLCLGGLALATGSFLKQNLEGPSLGFSAVAHGRLNMKKARRVETSNVSQRKTRLTSGRIHPVQMSVQKRKVGV